MKDDPRALDDGILMDSSNQEDGSSKEKPYSWRGIDQSNSHSLLFEVWHTKHKNAVSHKELIESHAKLI